MNLCDAAESIVVDLSYVRLRLEAELDWLAHLSASTVASVPRETKMNRMIHCTATPTPIRRSSTCAPTSSRFYLFFKISAGRLQAGSRTQGHSISVRSNVPAARGSCDSAVRMVPGLGSCVATSLAVLLFGMTLSSHTIQWLVLQ